MTMAVLVVRMRKLSKIKIKICMNLFTKELGMKEVNRGQAPLIWKRK